MIGRYLLILGVMFFPETLGHGRLMEPPARNCMWRFGFLNPINYNDNEIFCGGVSKQFEDNGGKCGVCGDSWEEPHPQKHETGGYFGNQIISRTYAKGSYIDLEVELTANHQGHFQFKLCPVRNIRSYEEASQSCFDNNIIRALDGSDDFPIDTKKMKTTVRVSGKLPAGLTCQRCIMQWTWRSANSWGNCRNGTAGLGCGPQETFRNCADVKIVASSNLLPRTDNPRAIYVLDKTGRNYVPLVVRSQVCVATPAYRSYHRMSDWCQQNCLAYPQNCPESICTCLDSCSAKPGSSLTDFECSKKCLRYPHDEQCPDGCECTGEAESSGNEDEFVILENPLLNRKSKPAIKYEPAKYKVQQGVHHLPYVVQPLVRSLGFPLLHLPLHTPVYSNFV